MSSLPSAASAAAVVGVVGSNWLAGESTVQSNMKGNPPNQGDQVASRVYLFLPRPASCPLRFLER